MTTAIIKEISSVFNINNFIIKSWYEHKSFLNKKEAFDFFEKNKSMITAKPFVKWVGGKIFKDNLKNMFILNTTLADSYKSGSQKARVMTEPWALENIFCPNCGSEISKYLNNILLKIKLGNSFSF